MKVKIAFKTVNADSGLIGLIFENDAERLKVIEHLQNMESKEGERWYVMYPSGTDIKDIEQFMTESEDKKTTCSQQY